MAWARGFWNAVLPRRKALARSRVRAKTHHARRHPIKLGRVLLTLLVLATSLAQASTYVYDANGRLRAVTKSTGDSAKYVYDVMGNLLHVDSVPAGQLYIFAFSPSHGLVGTTVAITGQGFSSTPANDVLKFNGTLATVTTATATTLTANVPVGATTGKISLTVGSQSATSDDTFVVDTAGQPPTISGFSPTIGPVGTNVTVTGTYLNPVPNQTTPAINGWSTTPSSVTNTHVQFPVANYMGSGKVTVTTPFGVGTSTDDFYVTPQGIQSANVVFKKRISIGESTGNVTLQASQYAAVLFSASSGEWVSLQANGFSSTASNVQYFVYAIDGIHPIASGSISTSTPSIHLPQLGASGTYSIWIVPNDASATFNLAAEEDPTLSTTAIGASVSSASANESKRLLFTANTGSPLDVGISGLSEPPDNDYVTVPIYDINNAFVATPVYYCSVYGGGCSEELSNLPAGTYQIIVSPSGTHNTVDLTATLSNPLSGTLPINTLTAVNVARPGQAENLTFSASAEQTFALQISNVTATPSGITLGYTISAPDGSTYANFGASGNTLQNLPNLPQPGTYSVHVSGSYNNGAVFSEQLDLLSGLTGTLEIGTPQTFSLTPAGQNVYLSFTASAGDNLDLDLSGLSASPSNIDVDVYDQNNNSIAYETCYTTNNDCTINLSGLSGGPYQAVISPQFYDGMSFTASLSRQ